MTKKKSPDVRSLLRGYLLEQCTLVLASEPALRLAPEPDAPAEAALVDLVHDTRVAIRRLRSTLRTFAASFAEPDRTVLIEESGWYAEALGGLRDLDVIGVRSLAALERLPEDLVLGEVRLRLETDLAERRASQRQLLGQTLDSERYARLREILDRWRSEPVWSITDEDVAIGKRVARASRRLRRRMRTAAGAVRAGQPDAAHLAHQARKAGKRHRYAVELAAPVLNGKADKLIAERKTLQDELGGLQDSAVTADYLTDLGRRLGNRAGRNAFSFGAMAADERQLQADGLRAFARAHG